MSQTAVIIFQWVKRSLIILNLDVTFWVVVTGVAIAVSIEQVSILEPSLNAWKLDIGRAQIIECLRSRECHGFSEPAGFATGFSGVRIRVGNSVPPKNPYPCHGFWVTHAVTRHMCDLKLGHQQRRRLGNNSCSCSWPGRQWRPRVRDSRGSKEIVRGQQGTPQKKILLFMY